ncbi:MAG: ChbG/HpnK family deacetylase [Acidobacteria bacterium]|nr:ChbG/HpnK family deacetylase [Acidobacteriota bacterium]
MTKFPKKLILNADDYGACLAVNAAIEELALANLLGGVSVLATGECWESAIGFLREHPGVSAGIHLNLVEGTPVSSSPAVGVLLDKKGSLLPRNSILSRWMLSPRAVSKAIEIEWRAQIERLLQAGIQLTHADSHQHLHGFPPAFHIALKLCDEYRIPALRFPREQNQIKQRTLAAIALNANLRFVHQALRKSSIRHNDHFLGFKRAGEYGLAELLTDVSLLQDGITEIALHPSLENNSPYPKLRGNDERKALLSQEFQILLHEKKIQLLRWHDI